MQATPAYGAESGVLQREYAGPLEFWHVPLYEGFGQTHETLAEHLRSTLTGYGAEVTEVDAREVEPADLPELATALAGVEAAEEANANPYGMLPPVLQPRRRQSRYSMYQEPQAWRRRAVVGTGMVSRAGG